MPAGRPPQRYGHIEKLEASELAKQRLSLMLRTLHGDLRVIDARAELALSETQFHHLRQVALRAAVEALTPKRGGRPRKVADSRETELTALRQEVESLRQQLQIERARAELATVLPGRIHLPTEDADADDAPKKGRPRRPRRRPRRR